MVTFLYLTDVERQDVKALVPLWHRVAPVSWPGFPCAMCGMWEQVSLRNGFFKEAAYLAICWGLLQ
jgi:hypothetical protein